MIDYNLILLTLYLDKQFNCYGTEYDGIIWNDSSPKPTKEELDSQWEEVLAIIKKEECKKQSQTLLNESDWTDLYSVRQKLENVTEWDNYRELIRELRINPIENPIFPNKPQTIWKAI